MYFGNDRMPLIREALERLNRGLPDAEGRRPSNSACPRACAWKRLLQHRLRVRAGARRHPRRRDQFPRHFDGGGRVSAQAAAPRSPGVEAAGDVVEVNAAEGVAGRPRDRQDAARRLFRRSRRHASQLVKLPSTFDYAEGARRFWLAMARPITR